MRPDGGRHQPATRGARGHAAVDFSPDGILISITAAEREPFEPEIVDRQVARLRHEKFNTLCFNVLNAFIL